MQEDTEDIYNHLSMLATYEIYAALGEQGRQGRPCEGKKQRTGVNELETLQLRGGRHASVLRHVWALSRKGP